MTSAFRAPRAVRTLLVLGATAIATIAIPASSSGQFLSFLGRPDAVGPQQSPQIPEFGTTSESVLVIGADAFELALGTEFLPNGDNSGRACATGAGPSLVCAYIATVSLPSGALITGLDLEACDGDAVSQFGFVLGQFSVPVQNGTYASPVFASGAAATPGCAVFPQAVSRTVNNTAEKLAFLLNVQWRTNLGFTTGRVHYKLQVSPAPGYRDLRRRADESSVLPVRRGARGSRYHGRLRQRQLLPRHSGHARADGRLPLEGARAALPELSREARATGCRAHVLAPGPARRRAQSASSDMRRISGTSTTRIPETGVSAAHTPAVPRPEHVPPASRAASAAASRTRDPRTGTGRP